MLMNTSQTHLDYGIWLVWGFYLTGMIVIVLRSLMIRSDNNSHQPSQSQSSVFDQSLTDDSLGCVALTASLFTVIIGCFCVANILPDVYIDGFGALKWIPAVLFAVLGYQLIVARLIKLTQIRHYISPIDFLNDRFRSSAMRMIASAILTVPTILFMALMLRAAGSLIEVLSSLVIPKLWGSIGIAILVLLFELMGGLSADGAIDMLHAGTMIIVFLVMFFLQSSLFDGFVQVLRNISGVTPIITALPTGANHLRWMLWSVPWIAIPFYPHVMTRISSARSSQTFRFALTAIALLPFFCIPALISFGLDGRSVFPNLPVNVSNIFTAPNGTIVDIFALTTRIIMVQGPGYYFFGSLLFSGVISMIMSTLSHNILGASSVVALDLCRSLLGSQSGFYVGRLISTVSGIIMLSLSLVIANAAIPFDYPLWIGFMNGIVLQIMPSYVLGMYSSKSTATALNLGMICGAAVSSSLYILLSTATTVPADLASWIGMITNVSIVYFMSFMNESDEESDEESSRSASSLDINHDSSSDSEQKTTSYGKFSSAIPSGLIGYRIRTGVDLDIALNNDIPEFSLSDEPSFSATYRADHARIASTTLGSIGRIGDGNTEPIHNPILLIAAAIFLILSTPFYFSTDAISATSVPVWAYLSVMSSVMAAMIIIYTMFSSWDVAAPIPRPKRRKESVSESTKDVDDSEMQSEESSLPNFNQQAQEKKPANRFLTPFQAFSRQAKKPEKTDSQSTIPASIGQQRRTPAAQANRNQARPKENRFGKYQYQDGSSLKPMDVDSELGSFSIEEDIKARNRR